MHILQVSGTAEGGSWFLSQIRELAARGHSVHVVVPAEGQLTAAVRADGFKTTVIPFRGYRPRDLPRLVRALRDLRRIAGADVDVVHAHLIKSIIVCRLAVAGKPPKLVSQVPGVVHLESPWLKAIDRATLSLDDVTVGSCTAFARVYDGLGARNTAVNFYGMDTTAYRERLPSNRSAMREELGMEPGDVGIVMAAHMYPTGAARFRWVGVKGHETFIDAASRAVRANGHLRFFIVGDEFVGDGSYRRRLQQRAIASGNPRLTFLGHRGDLPAIFNAMDISANPSQSESASYTMMESSLAGLPVVASSVGGLLDTVKNEITGILVPPSDPVALSAAFLRLSADSDLRRRLGINGRRHVEQSFDIRRTVDQLERIYRGVLANG